MVGSATSCLKCGRVAFCSVACATVAGNEWHESECLDASENPLEPAMSGMSPECRVALRAFRRAKREGTLKGSSEAVNPTSSIATAAEVATSAPSAGTRFCISSTNSGDDRMSTKFSDLQEHYTTRSARERDVLETKAAIATVLASGGCADVDTDDRSGERGSNTSAQEVCEALAAELVTALFKVRNKLHGRRTVGSSCESAELLSCTFTLSVVYQTGISYTFEICLVLEVK